ncbi:MAG: hypothetical protein C4317_08680 [Acidimicrobiia bacterium]
MFASRLDFKDDNTIIWSCVGALDTYSSSLAKADAASLPSCETLVVDLSRCSFVDSGGLRIVEEAAANCDATRVVVRTCNPGIWDLLRIAGLDRIFEVEIVDPDELGSRISRMRAARATKGTSYMRSEPSRIAPTPQTTR